MVTGKHSQVLIVGAGAFGLSTALHLLRRGWKNITIIDRSPTLPAPDAASNDINKVVRSSYSDPTYTRLAKEAIAAWKNQEDWGDTFHQCGVVLRGGQGTYAEIALQNDINHGINVKRLPSSAEMSTYFPRGVNLGPLLVPEFEGYINLDGGWTNARQGVEFLMTRIRDLGGLIETDKKVCGLDLDGLGVKLEDGTDRKADLIVIASGSWTPSIFPKLGIVERIIASGQSLATIQLSEGEAKVYADVPIVLDYTTGFYIFPPNASNVMKLAIHSAGYTSMQNHAGISVSTPRTHITHSDGNSIPLEMLQSLRAALSSIYPDLGSRPFVGTRLCWHVNLTTAGAGSFNNLTDSDWLIDFHPDYPSVLFATGGSGHAYKFLPILGGLVADRLENILDPFLTKKFAFNRIFNTGHQADLTRPFSKTRELDLSKLSSSEDLTPTEERGI